ncbi:hypothetical protein ACWCQK_34735 [Streptomyces sp. NPDC002306]
MRELANAVGLSPSTVSHHPTQMRAAGTEVATRGAQPPVPAVRRLTAPRDDAGLPSLIGHPRTGPRGA